MQFKAESSSEIQTCSNYKAHRITTKEIMAPFFFSINIAWGKFQERDACFRLVVIVEKPVYVWVAVQDTI